MIFSRLALVAVFCNCSVISAKKSIALRGHEKEENRAESFEDGSREARKLYSYSRTFYSNDLPKEIKDTMWMDSAVTVSCDATAVKKIKVVDIQIKHNYTSDLEAELISPDGKIVELFRAMGGCGDNMESLTLDDHADVSIGDAAAPFSGEYRPTEKLSAFKHTNQNGEWRLRIHDAHFVDEGILNHWGLEVSPCKSHPVCDLPCLNPCGDHSSGSSVPFCLGSEKHYRREKYVQCQYGGGCIAHKCHEGKVFDPETESCTYEPSFSSTLFTSTDVPKTITDGTSNSSTVKVACDWSAIEDVDVVVDIDHEFVDDVKLDLVSPDGTVVRLVKNEGGHLDDFDNTTFDDQADKSITTGEAPFTGSFRPEEPLNTNFVGENPGGVWTLKIADDKENGGGTLLNWGVKIFPCSASKQMPPPYYPPYEPKHGHEPMSSCSDIPCGNPCTYSAIKAGTFHHPFCEYDPNYADARKFIQCDGYGGCFKKECSYGTVWSKHANACVHDCFLPYDCSNPCTVEGYDNYHPFCYDTGSYNPHQYIQCDRWGGCFNMHCAPGTKWSLNLNQCVAYKWW